MEQNLFVNNDKFRKEIYDVAAVISRGENLVNEMEENLSSILVIPQNESRKSITQKKKDTPKLLFNNLKYFDF